MFKKTHDVIEKHDRYLKMTKCKICKKASSTYRKINEEEICQSCYDKCKTINAIEKANETVEINPSLTLGEISFEKYKEWFENQISKGSSWIKGRNKQDKRIANSTRLLKQVVYTKHKYILLWLSFFTV